MNTPNAKSVRLTDFAFTNLCLKKLPKSLLNLVNKRLNLYGRQLAQALHLRKVPLMAIISKGVLKMMKPIARKENLVVQKDTGELFIEDLVSRKMIYLNPTSAFVWEKCDGKKDEVEIAQELGKELGTSVSEKVVSMAINKLSKEELLVVA